MRLRRFRWYRLAADQGHARAQNTLGMMCANGLSVPQDDVAAYMWYSLAASRDYETASVALTSLEQKMTPVQIAEAQRLAREWDAAHPRD